MSEDPTDRIRAAIAKLEDVREHSTQGDWYADGVYVRARITEGDEVHTIPVARMDVAADDATRIATMSTARVIEAQLAILRHEEFTRSLGLAQLTGHGLSLADAINAT